MNELSNIKQTMSSREIAQYYEKPHSDVLKKIRSLEKAYVEVFGNEGKFSLVEYRDAKGEYRPEYQLTKSQTLFIASRFNPVVQAKVQKRWEELESKQLDFSNPDTVLTLVQNWKEEKEKRERIEERARFQEEQLKLATPKVELMEKILDTEEKIDIGQAAKILNLPYGRNILFKTLREKGIFFKNRNEPKQQYIERGYFDLKEKWIERNSHNGFMVVKVLVTQKGLEFINKILNNTKSNKQMALIQ